MKPATAGMSIESPVYAAFALASRARPDAYRPGSEPPAELRHAESRARADRTFQGQATLQHRVPDRDAVVEIADVPQKIRAVLRQPRRDDICVERIGAVLDDIDDVDAHRVGQLLLPTTHGPAVDVVDPNNRRPWRREIRTA